VRPPSRFLRSCFETRSLPALTHVLPAHLTLAPSPTRSLLPSSLHLLSRSSHSLDSSLDSSRSLINKRHQPFSAPHAIGVLRAKRARQGILLHIHAVNESRANRQKYDKQRGPVAQTQSQTHERQEHAGVGRMTRHAERPALDETMTAFALKVSSLGNVETHTMRAFRKEEMEGILAKIK